MPITTHRNFQIFFKLIRWKNLVMVVLTQYITTIFLVFSQQPWQRNICNIHLFFLSLSTVLIAAAGYIINDYYDIKIDLINKPSQVIIGQRIKRRVALGWHQVLNLAGILIAGLLDKRLLLLHTLVAFCLWWYANSLKRLPFWGNLMVATLTAFTLVVVAVYFDFYTPVFYAYLLFSFSLSLVREIIKDMEDIRGDALHGCQTLPIIWGISKTKKILFGLLAWCVGALLFYVWNWSLPHLQALFLGVLCICIGMLGYLLWHADSRQHFASLSLLCKIILLLGMLSMAYF